MNKIQEIRPEDIKKIVASDQIADALRKYKYVIGALYHQEVSADYTFQKAYCDLYNLGDNYSEEFKTKFFFTLEELKKKSDISFRDAFEILQSFEDRNEMTAASILVHTINPRFAIWDDHAAKDFFGMELTKEDDSVERCCRRYEDFSDNFYAYVNAPVGAVLVKAFDERFPNADIPNVIKVAFMLWQFESLKK